MHASKTANRGIEAKELEIADTLADETCGGGSECGSGALASTARTHTVDETNSYIQVVVQKQRRARLPAASSPAAAPTHAPTTHSQKVHRMEMERREAGPRQCEEAGAAAALRLLRARPLLLLPPLTVAALEPTPEHDRITHEHVRNESSDEKRETSAAGGDSLAPQTGLRGQKKAKSSWKIFNLDDNDFDTSNYGPERLEVYYFENAEAAHLATGGGARPTAVERAARQTQRRAAALLAELLAIARLVLAAPVAVLLAVLRCCLEAQRDLVSGVVQTTADYAWKPALALLYNAVLHPPLVFAASVARGARAALRPALAALGDALEPLASVLAAARLVHVERAPCHTCRQCPHLATNESC